MWLHAASQYAQPFVPFLAFSSFCSLFLELGGFHFFLPTRRKLEATALKALPTVPQQGSSYSWIDSRRCDFFVMVVGFQQSYDVTLEVVSCLTENWNIPPMEYLQGGHASAVVVGIKTA